MIGTILGLLLIFGVGLSPLWMYPIFCHDGLIAKLRNLKERRTMKNTSLRNDYFNSDGSCCEHGDDDCEECTKEFAQAEKHKASTALVVLTSSVINQQSLPSEQRDASFKTFKQQVKYAKKALGLDDEAISKKKMVEWAGVMEEAKKKITVGGFMEIVNDEIKGGRGIISGFFHLLGKIF